MFPRLTPVVLNLILINVVVFVAHIFLIETGRQDLVIEHFYLWKTDLVFQHYPILFTDYKLIMTSPFEPVQLVTTMFTHGGIIHIAFNMMALASIGSFVESVMGPKRFLALYLFSGLFASLAMALFDPSPAPVVGASAAISGVLVGMAFLNPNGYLSLLFLPFRFKAWQFVLGFAGLSALLVILEATGATDGMGLSHFGHLAGVIGGAIFLYAPRWLKKLRS